MNRSEKKEFQDIPIIDHLIMEHQAIRTVKLAVKDGKKPYRNFMRNHLYGSFPLSYTDNRNR